MREREATHVQSSLQKDKIVIHLNCPLDKHVYNVPLTIKTYVSGGWKLVSIRQGRQVVKLKVLNDGNGNYIIYKINTDSPLVTISKT